MFCVLSFLGGFDGKPVTVSYYNTWGNLLISVLQDVSMCTATYQAGQNPAHLVASCRVTSWVVCCQTASVLIVEPNASSLLCMPQFICLLKLASKPFLIGLEMLFISGRCRWFWSIKYVRADVKRPVTRISIYCKQYLFHFYYK